LIVTTLFKPTRLVKSNGAIYRVPVPPSAPATSTILTGLLKIDHMLQGFTSTFTSSFTGLTNETF
jgi:hypothetical protein